MIFPALLLANALGAHRVYAQSVAQAAPAVSEESASPRVLVIGDASIEVDIHLGQLDLDADDVVTWVRRAAEAVTVYYGRFPVRRARVAITEGAGGGRSIHGTTWSNLGGVQGLTRMRLGQAVSKADLEADWTMTHEFVHMALASLPDQNHWLEEGLATYVEPIARAQSGQLSAADAWGGMLDGMHQGEPAAGDRGLDETHTWGRTYWGGALFCLTADVEIRRATANRKGLEDALRAIVESGATIDTERSLPDLLRVGDLATGTTVLQDLYGSWKGTPITVDLDSLWAQLGIEGGPRGVVFREKAPLAEVRRSMTQRVSPE